MDRRTRNCYFSATWLLVFNTALLTVDSVGVIKALDKDFDKYVNDPTPCRLVKDTYTCQDIPATIPANVTSVDVTYFKGYSLVNKFLDPSWIRVEKLHLTGTYIKRLQDNAFDGLDVSQMVLILPNIMTFAEAAFSGLDALEKLDLIGMKRVDMLKMIKSTMNPRMLPKLKYFTFNPGVADHPPVIETAGQPLNLIFSKSLTSVNISNTFIQGECYATIMKFSLSGVDVLNVTGSTMMPAKRKSVLSTGMSKPSFQTLDMSRVIYPDLYSAAPRGKRKLGNSNITIVTFLTSVVHFYANYLYKEDSDIITTVNFTESPVFWKSVSFRGNNLVKINCSWIFHKNNTIHIIDLSDNKLEYTSPAFTEYLVNLQELYLSRNRLYRMQHSEDFENVFKPLRELRILDFSHNNLSFIPFRIFSANNKLETLVAGFNGFTTFTSDFRPLKSLMWLDLQSNQIQEIMGVDLEQLRSFVESKRKKSKHFRFKLSLHGNPIRCACDSSAFIIWLAYVSGLNSSLNSYTCQYEGTEINVDSEAIKKSKYLCIRAIVIGVSVSGSIILVSIVSAVAVVCVRQYKKRKRTRSEEEFYRQFKARQLRESFVIFMAHASLDEEFVETHLKKQFQENLQARMRTDEDVISTGDDFRPGHHITHETHRFIHMSCVFLAVVSKNFCSSKYCMAEMLEANSQSKPVILLFIENVDEASMSPYMQEVFNRTARAKTILREDGNLDFVPSLEKICESIVDFAVQQKL